MPTLSVGKRSKTQAGVTLLELIVVVALIALLIGIAFPSISSGIDTLRLNSAAQNVVTFINGGLNRAERRQTLVEVTVSKADGTVSMRSSEPGFERKLQMPEGISISGILPELPGHDEEVSRSFYLYPGGTVPAFGVELVNAKHSSRVVKVDPITGTPQIDSGMKEQ